MTAATYADLVAFPDDVKTEVLGGELVTQPSATFGHCYVRTLLGRLLGGPFDFDDDGPGGWYIVTADLDVRFTAHDIVRADGIGWLRPRLDGRYDPLPIDVVPDWICEVLSPSSTKRDRLHKSQLYARHGVPHYWLVDPAARLLEAYALDGGHWKSIGVYDETARARIAPFEAVELPVGYLFPSEAPTTEEPG
ncbi:Uma2 family endonuclease [Nannocystis sp. ILAH1]|uniref:Uma2 family endonuclease n=1 Tax=unclassified Nannocystis TaxID=2627009 RepID=UPI002270A349|nr:Uma2 family endonuclease [Nannocystis sp. ILAH1]MCY1066141.1 Uma2 family endonuclease [Nannocystis sp. RBIL2]